MYGMVNQAVKDLVVSEFGADKWNAICDETGLAKEDFVILNYYPDKLTYDLVGAASKILQASPETILQKLGKYWILYTSKQEYGVIMDLFGADLESCLKNLNNLHARMGLTLPHLTPPRFVYQRASNGDHLLTYISKRQGLSPMMRGLIEGLGERFNVKLEVEQMEPRDEGSEQVFRIREVA